jgi:hypothetical protein
MWTLGAIADWRQFDAFVNSVTELRSAPGRKRWGDSYNKGMRGRRAYGDDAHKGGD